MQTEIEERLWSALHEVKDPELPVVSVLELGMVHKIYQAEDRFTVEMLPTFLGCPALEMIKRAVEEQLAPFASVEVQFVYDPPWDSRRITELGREKLRHFGIAVPGDDGQVACPHCAGLVVIQENLFGPTACRSLFYCKRCKQPFEVMKTLKGEMRNGEIVSPV